jgi:DNA-binding transcriptional MerR regulator
LISVEKTLPPIPAKRYFTIGEVSELCGVKPYVLRYWEQEFTQLKPMKRRGNRRYYQHHEVLLIRRIRELLYDQGFTISGARNRLADGASRAADEPSLPLAELDDNEFAVEPGEEGFEAVSLSKVVVLSEADVAALAADRIPTAEVTEWHVGTVLSIGQVREELLAIRTMLAF